MKIVWGRSIGWNMSFNGMGNFKPAGFKPMEITIITDGAGCYPWRETFVMRPRKSIGGTRLIWTKAYERKVWEIWGTGFHMEPKIQYATLFEILQE